MGSAERRRMTVLEISAAHGGSIKYILYTSEVYRYIRFIVSPIHHFTNTDSRKPIQCCTQI